jgi:hypothetical protein
MDEPNWRHPKLQFLLSQKARLELQLSIIEDLIDDPEHQYDCGMEADYTTALTDKVYAFVVAARTNSPKGL